MCQLWTSKWPRGHQRGQISGFVLLVLVVLPCPVHATTVAMTTALGGTENLDDTATPTSREQQQATPPKQTTQMNPVPSTQSRPQTDPTLESTVATTSRPPTSAAIATSHTPPSSAAMATSHVSTSSTDEGSLSSSTERTSVNRRNSTLMTERIGSKSGFPSSDESGTFLYAERGTAGPTTDENGLELGMSDDRVTMMMTSLSPSMMTLTIIQWFLLAVAIAAFLFFVCICYHCCQVSRRRRAHSKGDHNRNTIDYTTPQSPKDEKWRNSWALEAMVYHIELPEETEEEMEAKHNPVFEEDETDAAATATHPVPHLTKL